MPDSEESDVIIIGAGPAGLATALGLAKSGLSVLIIDKETFPRDKVCGGGLGSRSIRVLNDLLPDKTLPFPTLSIVGFTVTTPDLKEYVYQMHEQPTKTRLGVTIHRSDFDSALLAEVMKMGSVRFKPDTEALSIDADEHGVTIQTSTNKLRGQIAVIADGAHSRLTDQVAEAPFERSSDAIALRGIFKGVTPDQGGDVVHFYFFRDVFPGYFWLFPLPNNLWNAGIYLPLRFKHQKTQNLNRLFFDLLQENSVLAGRFQDAVLTGKIESDVLPLAKSGRRFSGNRWLLAGDAAALVDPLAGEGIANALMSGQLAADHIRKAFEINDFGAKHNSRYDEKLLLRVSNEFKSRHRIINFFGTKPRLFSILFKQLARSKAFQRMMIKILYNKTVEGRLFLKPESKSGYD